MDRVAVFVDAGYLFAQGAIEMFGTRLKRGEMILDTPRTQSLTQLNKGEDISALFGWRRKGLGARGTFTSDC